MEYKQIVEQLEGEANRLQNAASVIRSIMNGGAPSQSKQRHKVTMSAAARARIGAAQRARWAKIRKEKVKA